MPKVNGFTMKERKFAKIYVKTGNKTLATKGAYGKGSKGGSTSPWAMNNYSSTLMKRPRIQAAIRDELDRVGLSDDKIADRLNKVINAGTEEVKLKFTDVKTALDAIKEVNKMKGNYAAEKKEIKKTSMKVGIDLTGKSQEDMVLVLNDVAKQIQDFQKIIKQTQEIKNNKNLPIIENGEIL